MAERAGGDLHDRHAGVPQAPGIVVGGKIAGDDADAQTVAQGFSGFLDERRFAGARRGKDIQNQDIFGAEESSVLFGVPDIPFHEGTLNGHDLRVMGRVIGSEGRRILVVMVFVIVRVIVVV
jgi:hypothetical protein